MKYDFNIKKIVLACYVPKGSGKSLHQNRPSHGLAIHLEGNKSYLFSDGKELIVKANDIIYLPKHSTYTVSSTVPGDCYAINFDIDENISFSPFVVGAKNYIEITKHFQQASSVWAAKTNSFATKCKAELYNIIYAMHSEYFSEYIPKTKAEIIQPAIDYIHKNYTNEIISIDYLSKMCGITPEYFRKIFKSFYGISPIHYINNLKITRAKELLKSQMYSVANVSQLSGFNDTSCFSREFKKATGTSPSDYKKSIFSNG